MGRTLIGGRQRAKRLGEDADSPLERHAPGSSVAGRLRLMRAIRRETMKPLAALDDSDAKLLFKLSDASQQSRLRHMAGLRGTREVLLTRERHKILQLSNIHRSAYPIS